MNLDRPEFDAFVAVAREGMYRGHAPLEAVLGRRVSALRPLDAISHIARRSIECDVVEDHCPGAGRAREHFGPDCVVDGPFAAALVDRLVHPTPLGFELIEDLAGTTVERLCINGQ